MARDPDELEEDEVPATADAEGLRRFIEGDVLPWFENRKKELANRPLIREQAFGEALDADKLRHARSVVARDYSFRWYSGSRRRHLVARDVVRPIPISCKTVCR